MNHIIATFQPFQFKQEILVYQDGQCVKTVTVPTDKVVSTIKGLCTEYSIANVDLVGNKSYLEKFQSQLLTDYNELNITVTTH